MNGEVPEDAKDWTAPGNEAPSSEATSPNANTTATEQQPQQTTEVKPEQNIESNAAGESNVTAAGGGGEGADVQGPPPVPDQKPAVAAGPEISRSGNTAPGLELGPEVDKAANNLEDISGLGSIYKQ